MKSAQRYSLILLFIALLVAGVIFIVKTPKEIESNLTLELTSQQPFQPSSIIGDSNIFANIIQPEVNITEKISGSLEAVLGNPAIERGEPLSEEDTRELLMQSGPELIAEMTVRLESSLNGPDSPFFILITDNDIVINPTDNSETQKSYLIKIASLFGRHFNNSRNPIVSISAMIQGKDIENFNEDMKRINSLTEELYLISTPKSWKKFHKKLLTTLKQQQLISPFIINYENDPAGALLALQKQLDLIKTANELNIQSVEALKKFGIEIQTSG